MIVVAGVRGVQRTAAHRSQDACGPDGEGREGEGVLFAWYNGNDWSSKASRRLFTLSKMLFYLCVSVMEEGYLSIVLFSLVNKQTALAP